MATVKVAIVGASGETGRSIVNALLESSMPKFEITSLIRPASLGKPINTDLKSRGVKIVPAELTGPQHELIKLLSGIEVVISAFLVTDRDDETRLATAAKLADVKRFVPCAFATVAPPRGVMKLRELKEDTLDHILKIHLPYTFIDVGWWYQITLPRLPSGRIDYAVVTTPATQNLGLDGNVPNARTDLRDIGRYVARIITDERTLNKKVFVHNEVLTHNQVFDVLERLSGEKLERNYLSEQEVTARIHKSEAILSKNPGDISATTERSLYEYLLSWGIRGDNVPEYAQYLGYLDGKELYPDFEFIGFESYVREVLDGKGRGVYR